MSFDYFKKNIVNQGERSSTLHAFYRISDKIIQDVAKVLKIPIELDKFYQEVGFGYMFDSDESYSIDRFLDPENFKKINLREDYYEFDPTLELFKDAEYNDKLIFFEVNEGVYLLISKEDLNGKNAIYYFDEKIADSLEEFLIRFDKEGHYFESDEKESQS